MAATERDPNGLDQHQPGAKCDAGKMRPALVLGDFANALSAVVEIGTRGAAKYSDSGWLSVPDGIKRYSEARMRHWLKMAAGETVDQDSGQRHQAHIAWNSLAILELMLREESEPELRCDDCGDATEDPWHSSKGTNRHYHRCDDCNERAKCRPIVPEDVAFVPVR